MHVKRRNFSFSRFLFMLKSVLNMNVFVWDLKEKYFLCFAV